MPMKRLITIAIIALAASTAFAQERPNVPPVLSPRDGGPDFSEAIESFRSAYASAKRPRLAVFWNRTFADAVTPTYDSNLTVSGKLRGSSSGARTDDKKSVSVDEQINVRSGGRIPDEQRKSGLGESDDWKIETAFQQPLLAADVILVDRATIMRINPQVLSTDNDANPLAIETAAMQAHADYLVEVLIADDKQSPTSHSYRVNIKRLADGRLLNTFVTSASPSGSQRPQYFANEHGFTPAPQYPSPELIGQEIGIEVMAALRQSFVVGNAQ